MPKGSKTCSKCGHVTGPRAYICSQCQNPFVLKGKVLDVEAVKLEQSKVDGVSKTAVALNVLDFMSPVAEYKDDPINLRVYDGRAKLWESKDGQYRIRYEPTYMGVVPDEFRYKLLRRNNDPASQVVWDLLIRCKDMERALKAFNRVLNGLPVKSPKKVKTAQAKGKQKLKNFLKKLETGIV